MKDLSTLKKDHITIDGGVQRSIHFSTYSLHPGVILEPGQEFYNDDGESPHYFAFFDALQHSPRDPDVALFVGEMQVCSGPKEMRALAAHLMTFADACEQGIDLGKHEIPQIPTH